MSSLNNLLAHLADLHEPAEVAQLAAAIGDCPVDLDEVAAHAEFGDEGYRRVLLHSGTWHDVWVLGWKNGQRSPIHNHRGSACAALVLRGAATETLFEFAPNGLIKPIGSVDHSPGDVILSSDADVHQISNLQADDAELITLHVYSPPLLKMATYSLTHDYHGEDVWHEERRVISRFPENMETPMERLGSWVTPNRLFFVRSHFDPPPVDEDAFRLELDGLVGEPQRFSLAELREMPQRTVFATVECAGNGRSFLEPNVSGVQWGAGAVGHAEWTGVPLRFLLESAGLGDDATDLLFTGRDRGQEAGASEPENFARTLPREKALHPDTLVALRMNGEPLDDSHGGPVRLFVPGWYGVASVKWLARIEAIDYAFRGYYQSKKYTKRVRVAGKEETVVVGPMPVKSEIIKPSADAELGIGANRIFGLAWAGEQTVAKVEVSVDGGGSWQLAELLGPRSPYSWVLWEYLWEVAEPGEYKLLARAADTAGRVQPREHDPLCGGYEICFTRERRVQVVTAVRAVTVPADVDALLYDMNAYAEQSSRTPLDVDLEFSLGAGI